MQPTFKITANSQDITKKIADRLISLEISDKAGVKSDRATITIDDRDQLLDIPKRGAKLEISIGYVGQALVRMGSYVVDEVEVEGPERQMVIRANAADMTGKIKAPKERSWPGVTFGNLVKKIAKEHSLQPSIPSDLASRNLGHIDQTESDMQLLSRICSEQGATFKVSDGRLVVANHAGGKTASGKSLPVATIYAHDCERWNATIAERGKYQSVIAYWQNMQTGQRVEVKAGQGEPALTLKNSYKDEETAKQAAKSKLNVLGRGTGTVSISGYIGDPYMSAERIATLVGFRNGVDGSGWVVNEVTHSLSGDGYTNSISLEIK